MSYKIVVDSCGELTEEMKASGYFETASLSMEVGGRHIPDDETFDQKEFLRLVAQAPECPKSSCPSPQRYMEACCGQEERIYIVTLSSRLSGSYNSAMLGRKLYLEEHPHKDIYVFDSRSASVGETLIALKIRECEQREMSFQKVVDTVEEYIKGQSTYFVLETLDTLRKNGRLTGLKAIMATALHIKPVMTANEAGEIAEVAKCRGTKKALSKLVEAVVRSVRSPQEKILAISHCNCRERAESVKAMLLEKETFGDVIILDTAGISSMYAADGGIIVVV
ncbi:DegV family protein [Suipraeoptans intestinalis]|uniref:DegV family protein n=1 Tax=Suipraeoptans intestinalis TaxID=2606628 RepID=UPI0023F225F9|nr:DegV family protein [Suipraeoptans intestinalis]MDD7769629.1 DegV family protein [Suipraeoptans intestinalis]MDY3121531.1 DegV family protein [Suipraeoptans intestinalis]